MKAKKRKITKSKKKAKIQGVNENTTFAELLEKYPKTAEILMNQGMHCIGCGMAGFETIEQGAMMHGLNPKKLVEEINKKIAKKKQTK